MKKIFIGLSILMLTLGLTACEEVSDLIKIQNANKEVSELHVDMEVATDIEVDLDSSEEEFGFDFALGLEVSMDISNGIVHSFTSVDLGVIPIVLEQYFLTMNGERLVYSNIFGIWTKETVEESEQALIQFDASALLSSLNGSFEIIDPITVDGKELKQMKLILTVEDVQNILGVDFTSEDMSSEEIESLLNEDVRCVLGYTEDTYLIERVDLDLTNLFASMPEEVQFSAFDIVITFSKHNDIGTIELPQEALNA